MEEIPETPQENENDVSEDETFDITVCLYGITDDEWASIRYAIKEQGVKYKTI